MKCQRWVHRLCSDVPRQVSLLSCRDAFFCRICLGHNYYLDEKLEFKRVRCFRGSGKVFLSV